MVAADWEVVPVMTRDAVRFLGPLTLEALTGRPVRIDYPELKDVGGIEHISLVRAADLLLIAPLTANTMAKLAHGLADNFLTATYLAHRGKTLVCPAMNTAMLEHPATRRNLDLLARDGVFICHGEAGSLACGETGAGRMAEPETILDYANALAAPKLDRLSGKTVLISAGPTQEDIDPVRYLTNKSSGKMGVALARAFRNAGAKVTLAHGPVQTDLPVLIDRVAVRSAAEMAEAVLSRAPRMDIVIMNAAVADYTPARSEHKLKKKDFDGVLRLERTTDILAELGRRKPSVLVGFAAESEHLLEHARTKLEQKNLDFIFVNDISGSELGFGSDHNHLIALSAKGPVQDLGTGTKNALADLVARLIDKHLQDH